MNRAADDSGDTGALRLSAWFGVTGLLLLATLLAAAFVQVRQYALLNMTVQYQDDYLVLSLYQVEIEYLRLREQMRAEADAPGGGNALQLRYDIFVQRWWLKASSTDKTRTLVFCFSTVSAAAE